MDASVIQALLTADPFRPFRLSTSRALKLTIASPADAFLTRSTLYVAEGRAADGIPASALAVPLAQIAVAETL